MVKLLRPCLANAVRLLPLALTVWACGTSAQGEPLFQDTFDEETLRDWQVKEGKWSVRDGQAVAEYGFSVLLRAHGQHHDFEIAADVGYSHDEAHAAAGIVFRFAEDSTGYAVALRDIEKGVHPESGRGNDPSCNSSARIETAGSCCKKAR